MESSNFGVYHPPQPPIPTRKETVLAAVAQNVMALEFLSADLRADRVVVLPARR